MNGENAERITIFLFINIKVSPVPAGLFLLEENEEGWQKSMK